MMRYSPYFISLLLLAGLALTGFKVPPYDAQKAQEILEKNAAPISKTISAQGREMHFVSVEQTSGSTSNTPRPLIIFVHGAPGDFNAFSTYLVDPDLQGAADMISIDRLGYGRSQPGKVETDIEVQAALLHEAVKLYPNAQSVILVGHSYGGPVIARYGMDYPKGAQSLIMLAPAVDPATQKKRWYQLLANTYLVKWMLPVPLRVTTKEMLPLKSELQKMEPLWHKITADIVVVQGEKDWLVPPAHAAFVKSKKPEAEIILLKDDGHFIPWERYELVKKTLLKAATAKP